MQPGAPLPPLFTRAFVLAAAAHFFHALSFSLYLHLPGFLHAIGADEMRIGVIVGTMGFTAIAARPLLGRAMDLHGRRIVILVGGFLHVFICVAYLSVRHMGPWVYFVRVVHGLAEAMLFAAMFALAADVVPASRRIQGIALFGVSGMLPMSISGPLGDIILSLSASAGAVAPSAPYARLFQVAACFAATGLALSLPLPDTRAAADASDAPRRRFRDAVLQRDLVPLWGTGLCFATAIAAYFTFMKTYVQTTGVGSVGLFFSAYSGAAVLLRIVCGRLPDRLGPRAVLFPALGSLALGLLLLARARGSAEVGVAGVLCGLGHGFTFPILLSYVVQRARPSERGAALAVYTSLFDAGTLVGGPMLGAIVSAFGYPAMFRAAAGLVMLGVVGFVVAEHRLQRGVLGADNARVQ